MGVSERWVGKRLQRMRRQGDAVVVHGRRGRASNWKIATGLQARAIEILKQPEWQDFGPAFAAQQLGKRLDLSAILCHVEPRVIGNDYTFSFAGQRYQIAREDGQAGMRERSVSEAWLFASEGDTITNV